MLEGHTAVAFPPSSQEPCDDDLRADKGCLIQERQQATGTPGMEKMGRMAKSPKIARDSSLALLEATSQDDGWTRGLASRNASSL